MTIDRRPQASEADKRADARHAEWAAYHLEDEHYSAVAAGAGAYRPYVNGRLRTRLAGLAVDSPQQPAVLYYDAFQGEGMVRLYVSLTGEWTDQPDSAVWMTEAQARDLRHDFPSLDYAQIFVLQTTGEIVPW